MPDPLAIWHAEHDNFLQLLDLVEVQLRAYQAGEQPDYELMGDVVYYLRHYSDRYHHRWEDAAFSRLVERDPTMELLVGRLTQEHRAIAEAGEELLRYLQEIADDVMIERAKLEQAVQSFLVYYRHHIAAEENEIMPRSAQVLTPDDWAQAKAAVPRGSDPLFGDNFESRYRALRRQITLDARGPTGNRPDKPQ
jgi:hemerythrin-like domain-containing protein